MSHAQRAVVVYGTNATDRPAYTTTDAVYHKIGKATPSELILHESVRGLVTEVAELRDRCEKLEERNTQLNRAMQMLEKNISGAALPSLTRMNMTGYASSESSEDEPEDPDSEDLSKKFAGVGEVLERFSVRMEAHDRRQAEMASELNALRNYKEKSSALFTALKAELESAPTDQDDAQTKELVVVNGKVEALGEDLTSFQRVFNGLLRTTKYRVATEEKIDGAATKVELYRHFKDLEKALWEDDDRGSCGIFRGSEDELLAFRGRLLRRLALFDGVGDALQEALSADVDY